MKNQASKSKQILIVWLLPLLLGAGALLVFVLFTYPNLKQVFALRTKILEQESRLQEKLVPKRAALENLDNAKLNSDLTQVVLLLPNKPEPPLFLATIEEAASQVGVAVDSLQYQEASLRTQGESKAEDLNSISLGFLLEGEEEKIIELLKILFNTAPILSLDTVTISHEGVGLQQASGSIIASFYSSSLPQDLGSIEGELTMLTKKEEEALLEVAKFTSLPTLDSAGSGEEGSSSLEQEQTQIEAGKSNPFQD